MFHVEHSHKLGREALRNSNCAPDEELQDSDRRAST